MEPFWRDFGFVLVSFATWPKLEKSHGAKARAPKLRIRGIGNAAYFKKNASGICPKTVAKNDPKMEPIWMPNGAKMEPKRHPKSDVFFDVFPDASGNTGGTASEPRL